MLKCLDVVGSMNAADGPLCVTSAPLRAGTGPVHRGVSSFRTRRRQCCILRCHQYGLHVFRFHVFSIQDQVWEKIRRPTLQSGTSRPFKFDLRLPIFCASLNIVMVGCVGDSGSWGMTSASMWRQCIPMNPSLRVSLSRCKD